MPKFISPKPRTALACLMAASGLRQHQVAQRFNLSASTVQRYATGLMKTPAPLAKQLAAYFGVTPTAVSAPKPGEIEAAATRLFRVCGEGKW